MSGHSCTVTSWQINFVGAYDADSNFVVSQNDIRARYVSNADSRFGGGAGLQLPKMGQDSEGEPVVIVPQVQLTAEQITTIQNVIEEAMTATQYHGCDFGPAPQPPAAE
jgi:hypothetical protein